MPDIEGLRDSADGKFVARKGIGTVTTEGNIDSEAQAVGAADGDIASIGAKADAAWSGTGSGSEIAILKKIEGELVAPLTATIDETTLATSANQATANTSLASIKSDADSLVTNTTGLATQATAAAEKTDLDSIVTNTTGLGTAANQATANTALAASKTDLDTLAGAVSSARIQVNTKRPLVLLQQSQNVDVKTDGGVLADIDTTNYEQILVMFNLKTLSGGSTPTVIPKLRGRDSYGTEYSLIVGGTFNNAVGNETLNAAPGAGSVIIPATCFVKWNITGGPTTANADISVYGR